MKLINVYQKNLITKPSRTLDAVIFPKLVVLLFTFLFNLSLTKISLAGSDTSADFLKLPIGAEASSMGQAYSALSYGLDSLNWNPAGLAVTPSFASDSPVGLSFSHQDHFVDNSLDQVGLAFPATDVSGLSWGLNMVRLSYGTQERRDNNREKVGSFESSDLAVGMGVAKNLGSFKVGTQLKFIGMKLANYQSNGLAMDLGLLTKTPFRNATLGFSARNIGPEMKFIDEKFNLPLTLTLGSAYKIMDPLYVSLDIQSRPYQDQVSVSLGTEFLASKTVSLRAGYLTKVAQAVTNSQKEESNRGNFGGLSGLAGGLGIRFGQFSLDYSITPFGELGNSQTLSLATWFGGQPHQEFDSIPELKDTNRPILILPTIDQSQWWESSTQSE